MRSNAYVNLATIEFQARGWLEEIRRSVAPRPHLRPRPGGCALLVIDMLRYFAHPEGRSYLPAASAIVPNIASLIEAWRDAEALVVFTQHCHRGDQDLGMLGRFFSDYIRHGEPDAEIISELAPFSSEPVIQKTTYDAFLGTSLKALLAQNDVQQVLITGVLTHMCCETTARSAFCRGFEVYVAVDATASSTQARHLGALLSMADSVAVAMSTAEVLELCHR